jgi:hypothetical protein
MELQMDNKLSKLFDKLESIKEKEADILEEIKNRLYDLEEASDEDDFEEELLKAKDQIRHLRILLLMFLAL